jgi:hypothetical protein
MAMLAPHLLEIETPPRGRGVKEPSGSNGRKRVKEH